jgi:ABC-2 type transport system ATP-binding protein
VTVDARSLAVVDTPPAPEGAPRLGAQASARSARPPIVDIRELTKVYEPSVWWMHFLLRSAIDEPVRALRGITLSVHAGQVCVIVGPNGAGKSTLFRILTGLTTATTGRASVNGLDVEREGRSIRKLIGFVPADDRSLYLRHTCRQNLTFHGRLQGFRKKGLEKLADETLDMVGLADARNRTGFALSSGMRARLQLARALIHRPKVLILDEPTANVDPVGSYNLLNLVEQLTHDQGLAVLLSSHRLEEIDAFHDNVAFLDRGVLVHWGDLNSLRDMWERPRIVVTFEESTHASHAAAVLSTAENLEITHVEGEKLTASVDGRAGDLLAQLGPLVGRVVTIEEARMPLRELLARLAEGPPAGIDAHA